MITKVQHRAAEGGSSALRANMEAWADRVFKWHSRFRPDGCLYACGSFNKRYEEKSHRSGCLRGNPA